MHHLDNAKTLKYGPQAILPNNEKIQASHQDHLSLHPKLNLNALVYPKLHSKSLLSTGRCVNTPLMCFIARNL